MVSVVIIGGGFAGLAAAIKLAENGVKATIIEARETPIAHTTGGIADWWFEGGDMKPPEEAVVAPLLGVNIVSPKGTVAKIRVGHRVGAVLDPEKYLKFYIEKAKSMGVGFVAPATFYAITSDGVEYHYQGAYRTTEADWIIAADGARSSVRRFMNLPEPKTEDLHIGYEETIPNSNYEPDMVSLYIDSHIAKKGYWWVFPDDAEGKRIRVGLGVPKSVHENPKENFYNRLLLAYPEFDKTCSKVVSGTIPTAPLPRTNLAFHKEIPVLFVGDAGFFCSPLHGGGIGFGIMSGILAAEAVLEDDSFAYDKKWKKKIQPILKRHYLLKKALYTWNDADFDKAIQCLSSWKYDFGEAMLDPNSAILDFVEHVMRKYPGLIPKVVALRLK